MKRFYLFATLLASVFLLNAQSVFYTKTGHVWFFSGTPIEDIEAHNKKAVAAFDATNNILEFKIKMKDFIFEKSLMQEHFNENYIESDKFPYAVFKGKVDNFEDLDVNNLINFEAKVSGTLELHGVKEKITASGFISQEDKTLVLKADFQIRPADYKIKIPKIVIKNIAEIVDVHVDVKVNSIK